jgi:hypothetical protein
VRGVGIRVSKEVGKRDDGPGITAGKDSSDYAPVGLTEGLDYALVQEGLGEDFHADLACLDPPRLER